MTSGCSWFHHEDHANDATQPLANVDPIAAPTNEYRRDGLLGTTPQDITAPTAAHARPIITPELPAAPQHAVTVPEYLVLGSVVANVNGSPIYAHELMRQVAPVLKARARELDDRQFKLAAQRELTRQRQILIRDELEYAAAQRNTTQDEVKEAKARTFAFRDRLISQSGGSEQVARARIREGGEDFDKMLAQEERRELVKIYYIKKIFPRVTVTVDEMRRFYEQNREKRFTVASQASIRLIRIDAKDVGTDAIAQQQINDARRRASAGENFDALSDEYNKMPVLIQNEGKLGPISKGAYAVGEVDDAIWATEPGKVTPVVKSGTAYYVALVVDKKEGRTMAFDEQEVQTAINGSLREQKMAELQEKQRDALMTDAVIQADDTMLQPVVEMAMQMYGEWRAGTAG